MKRFLAFFGAWIICLIVFFILLGVGSSVLMAILAPLVIIVPIWFIDDKKTKGTDIEKSLKRLKNYKEFKTRYIVSGSLYFFFLIMSIGTLARSIDTNNAEEEKKKQEIYNNTPTPIISLLSQTGSLGAVTGYDVKFTISGANSASVNGEKLPGSGTDFEKHIELVNPSTDIVINASNGIKSSSMKISVSRDKTEKEIEDEKIAEQKRIEQEKQARIQKEAEEKTQRTKEAKEKRIKTQYEKIAKYGYEYEVKNKLFNKGFKEFSSEYTTAPDGSTQLEFIYVNNIEGCYVEVSLQGSYSLDSHYYSVKVDCN